MSFDVQLDPSDWKKFAKQGLKKEVFGTAQTNISLVGLVEAMDARQRRWHNDQSMHSEERMKMFGRHNSCKENGESATCLRMVHQIKKMVEAMDWE